MTLRRRDRIVFGVVLPVVVMIVGMMLIASVDSSAGAAEFAALAVFFMLLISLPITLVINTVVAFQNVDSRQSAFLRGLIVPGIVMLGAVIYQSGLWDRLT